MKIVRTSMLSGVTRTLDLDITSEQLHKYYVKGELLQEAFPHLSASDREFIKSGITDEEWDNAFEKEND